MDRGQSYIEHPIATWRKIFALCFMALWAYLFFVRATEKVHLVGIPALMAELRLLQPPDGSVVRGEMGVTYKHTLFSVSQSYVSYRTGVELAQYFRKQFEANGWRYESVEASTDTYYQFCKDDLLGTLSIAGQYTSDYLTKFTLAIRSGDHGVAGCVAANKTR